MKVTTQFKSNAAGRSQVIARAQGKQKTHNVDLSKSNDWNHGAAAAALISAGFSGIASAVVRDLDAGKVEHGSNDAGTVQFFRWED